jgi:hypothetical protein
VEIVAIRGTWSEVSRVREAREEEGKAAFQAWLMNMRSSQTRVGVSLRFDQVNSRSCRGSMMRARLFILSLKREASTCEKLSLFLSEGSLVKLKSPARSQGVLSLGSWVARSRRKLALSAWEQGA